ncbi:AraC family transcriptional regulator [Flagellimonas nanhaiensis]|uniref:AraC family transcriptional regulator n=2 Tax=Flagellimonas nanhaiensis TaxID=2292706 RepID=A0A371JQP1_9FLAO|nr:AraC family transcriptional regulator [Allomuricauda nanhaiensis]
MLKSKGVSVLNKLLGLLCFCFGLLVMNTYLNLSGLISSIPFFQDISNNSMWFCGPALYLYVIHYGYKTRTNLILLNTLPFLIPASINIFLEWPWFEQIIPFVAYIQISLYLFLALKFLVLNYSSAKQFYNWILPSILVFAVILLTNFVLSILLLAGIEVLPNAVLQSFTTFLALPIFFLAYKEMNAKHDLGIVPEKYRSTYISNEKSSLYLEMIESAMKQDKLFLQPKLTLQSFSQHLNVPPKYVSQTINQNLGISFTEYLIGFRIEEVKSKLMDPNNAHLTIYGMAQDSGFNSASRFNFLFKKHTGYTPKEFQKLHSA